jgi:GNAT superfamily N-acetyltransferase
MGISEDWPGGVAARAIERADAEAWAELLAAAEKADHADENYDADDLLEELGDPKLNAATDTIGLWSDGLLVGFGKVSGPDEVIDVHRVFTEGCVHPQWRGRGLGGGLMTWLTRRATAMHRERHPEAPGEIGAGAISTNSSALTLFATRGFEACRYFFHMERDLGAERVPTSPAADGLRLMEFEPTYDEALRLAHNEVFSATSTWRIPPPRASGSCTSARSEPGGTTAAGVRRVPHWPG